jgi:hypothetical protein
MTRLLATFTLMTLAGAASALAQQAPPTSATSLSLTAGLAHADDAARPTIGGSARWELTPHLALEGAARWMDRVGQPAANAGEISIVYGLGGRRDSAVPYVLGGIGLQHRAFERGSDMPHVPQFYRRRLRPASTLSERQSFTDPTVVVGLGVDVALARTVTLRPDVRTVFVVRGGRHDTVFVATVGLGYRFEHKPVTPSR